MGVGVHSYKSNEPNEVLALCMVYLRFLDFDMEQKKRFIQWRDAHFIRFYKKCIRTERPTVELFC